MLNFLTKFRFLDPSQFLPQAGLPRGATVADFGCGNGFYPVALGKIIGEIGQVYAVDIKNEALEATVSAAKHAGLKNIYTLRHDLELPGLQIKDNSCDAVVLAGILHLAKSPKNILREAYRVLKTGGKLLVVEWKKEDAPQFFGPNASHRISQASMHDLLTKNNFRPQSEIQTDHFHYSLIYVK